MAMSKFSSEERMRIISETRDTLARSEAEHEPPPMLVDEPHEDVLAQALSIPVEDRVAKWQREADEQTARFARQRRAEQRRNAEPAPDLELLIAESVASERAYLIEVLAETIVELEDRQAKAIDSVVAMTQPPACPAGRTRSC
jgi:hypothetical protein